MSRSSSRPIGLAVGVGSLALFEIGMAISLAALVAQGTGSDVLPRLIGALLLGAAIGIVLIGLRSSIEGIVSSVQDTPLVIVAGVVAGLAAEVAADEQTATVLAFVAACGLATGVVLLVLGLFGLGEVVRYLPAPVMSGFRLGTGWLLFIGGLEVAAGRSIDADAFEGVAGGSLAMAVAVLLVVVVTGERESSPAVFSGSVLAVVAAFYGVSSIVSSVSEIEADGWLLGPFESDPSWRPLDLADVDWGALAGQIPAIAAVAFVAAAGLLLNTGALEAEYDVEADADHDLRATGLTNILVGVTGSSPVYVMFSGTVLGRRLGLVERRHLALVGAVIFAALVLGSSVAAFMPRFTAGGLLAGLGVSLALGWAKEQRGRPVTDIVVAVLVALVIGAIGVLEGVGFGVVMAVLIFVRRYSQIDPARRLRTIAEVGGRTDRSPEQLEVIREQAATTVVLELDGFLFFGSVARIRESVYALDDQVRDVVLDFTAVSGIDGSAEMQLRQLIERQAERGRTVRTSGAIGAHLHGRADHHHPSLDQAVSAIEDQLLAASGVEMTTVDDGLALLLADVPPRPVAAGTDLFVVGDASDEFVLVESGWFSVWLDPPGQAPVRLRRVGPGSLLGELAYATGAPRGARATADEDAVVRVVDRELRDRQPAPFTAELNRLVLARVAQRLTATNDIVRGLSR